MCTKFNCVYSTMQYLCICIYGLWPEIKLYYCYYYYYYTIQ